MMGRTFAFRVKWQKEWKQGSVLECKDNKVLVDRIQKEVRFMKRSLHNCLFSVHIHIQLWFQFVC
jgi:CRISPR/Cas system-associated endoribonuclease Cas2